VTEPAAQEGCADYLMATVLREFARGCKSRGQTQTPCSPLQVISWPCDHAAFDGSRPLTEARHETQHAFLLPRYCGDTVTGLTGCLDVPSALVNRGHSDHFWIRNWILAEYLVHRFLYHRVYFFHRLHDAHQASPNDLIGGPPLLA
jgi:hypothetical protein